MADSDNKKGTQLTSSDVMQGADLIFFVADTDSTTKARASSDMIADLGLMLSTDALSSTDTFSAGDVLFYDSDVALVGLTVGTVGQKVRATSDGVPAYADDIRWLTFSLVEAGTDVAVATNIYGDFVSPIAGTILQSDTTPFYLYATNSTAGTTGTMVVDISIGGTSIMATNKLDFDTTEKTTTTAATPPDLTTTALAVGDIITIDVDAIHTTAAKGLAVYIAVRES